MARGLFIEAFYGGSHRAFADGLARHSHHEFVFLTLPGDEWRKRMRRGAIELARQFDDVRGPIDFVVATDMLDLSAFLALTRRRLGNVPTLLYMHENQFTYPRLRGTKLNSWFGQVNYLSALAADVVAFNSEFHRKSFTSALATLSAEPNNWLAEGTAGAITEASVVLPVGVDLEWMDAVRVEKPPRPPIVLWNHRWEFDKSPDMFVRALRNLRDEAVSFRIAVAGETGLNPHPALLGIPEEFGELVYHHGYAESRNAYAQLLWESSVVVSTTRHEFFGISTVEALYAGCFPVLPRGFNYPALVPPTMQPRCLYDSEAGLLDLLRSALAVPVEAADRQALRTAASRWRWPEVVVAWDEAIDGLVAKGGRHGIVVKSRP